MLVCCNIASKQVGRFVYETDYEWSGSGYNSDRSVHMSAPTHWRMQRMSTGKRAFEGLKVLMYGEFIPPPSKDTLIRAVHAGGGSQFKHGVDFVICDKDVTKQDNWVLVFLAEKLPCVSPEYFVSWIAKPRDSRTAHVLFGTEEAAAEAEHKFAETLRSPANTR
eukprot:jgi/Chlat1/4060/Chrsp26S04003